MSITSCNESCRQRPSNLAVRVGSFHRQQQDPDQADIAVTEVRLHEDYDPWALHKYPDVCSIYIIHHMCTLATSACWSWPRRRT